MLNIFAEKNDSNGIKGEMGKLSWYDYLKKSCQKRMAKMDWKFVKKLTLILHRLIPSPPPNPNCPPLPAADSWPPLVTFFPNFSKFLFLRRNFHLCFLLVWQNSVCERVRVSVLLNGAALDGAPKKLFRRLVTANAPNHEKRKIDRLFWKRNPKCSKVARNWAKIYFWV